MPLWMGWVGLVMLIISAVGTAFFVAGIGLCLLGEWLDGREQRREVARRLMEDWQISQLERMWTL
jgi:hypothetical protein